MDKWDWFKIGREFYDGKPMEKARIKTTAKEIDWLQVPPRNAPPLNLPMMAGMGINEVIKNFKIPKVSAVAVTNELAPFVFYGVRGCYQGEVVELFFIDSGTHLTPVCARHC
jgi:hypothetical protein